MSTPLEIVVTGDVSGARSALQSIQGELGKTAISSKNAGAEFDKMNAQMQQFKRAASQSLNPELVEIYNRKVTELQASMKQLATAADAEAASTFKAEEATKAMSVAVNNTSVGAQRLQAAISRSTDPLQIAAREINNFSRRLLYMAGAGVMQLAIEGFQLILPYIQDFITGMDKTSFAAKLAADNIKNFNDINKEAGENVAKQTASLSAFYSIATDVNRSMEARVAAVRELQKEYPDYFKNISQENILNGNAKDAYDALTNSLIANALAKAQLDKITKIGVSRADIKSEIDDLVAERARRLAAVKGAIVSTPSIGSGTGGAPTIISVQQQKEDINTYFDRQLIPLRSKIKSFDAQIDHIKNALNPAALLSGDGKGDAKLRGSGVLAAFDEQIKVLEDYKNNVAMTAAEIASVNAQIKKLKAEREKYDPKPGVEKKNFDNALKALEDYYKKVQAQRVKDFDANLTDSKKNTTAINAILLQDEMDFLEKKLALIKKYGKKEGDVQLQIAKTNQKAIENQQAFIQDQLNTLPKVQNAPVLNIKATTEKISPKIYYDLSDAIKKNIKLQQEHLELMNETANALNKTVGPAFDVLFQKILSGSGNAFKAFGDALKQMIIQLGAAILKAALFAAILSVINPYSTGIPGQSGFGDIFKSLLHFSQGGEVKGYAGGGSISGPGTSTSDSILARLSRGEYVMNANAVSTFGSSFFDSLNKGILPRFNSGGPVGSNLVVAPTNNVFIPDVTIKGQDLLITFNRASARASRNG